MYSCPFVSEPGPLGGPFLLEHLRLSLRPWIPSLCQAHGSHKL